VSDAHGGCGEGKGQTTVGQADGRLRAGVRPDLEGACTIGPGGAGGEGADKAWTDKLGAWHDFGHDLLLAYEYRACVKLGIKNLQDPAKAIAEAYERVCVDLRTMTEAGLYGYHAVPPQHRLWIWASDLEQARTDLPLVR
jgi:hypothetical protein